jgi:mannitol-1-/sugar-/sorbitol-6-phosphatase
VSPDSAVLNCDVVLFDLDGVLVDSRAVVERTWRRWAELRGVIDPDLVRRAHGRRSVETVREVAPTLDSDQEVRWLAAAELSDFDGVVALPGAADALAALSDAQRAIVTSGGRELARKRLLHVGLPVPAILMAAEDVSEGKPSPEGFLAAASKLGVDPSRCIVIEDTPAGIQAARGAGCRIVALTTTFPKNSLHDADVVVESLANLQIIRTKDGIEIRLPFTTRITP